MHGRLSDSQNTGRVEMACSVPGDTPSIQILFVQSTMSILRYRKHGADVIVSATIVCCSAAVYFDKESIGIFEYPVQS